MLCNAVYYLMSCFNSLAPNTWVSSSVQPAPMSAVGILGGTFDPVHQGHLAIATAAMQQAQLDQLLWVPDPYPPHKAKLNITPISHRIQMIQRAIAQLPQASRHRVWRVAQDSAAQSFAITTLNALHALQPAGRWYWILGLDAFCSLPKWYRSADLVDRCHWIVAPRSDAATDLLTEQCEQVVAHFARCDRAVHYQLLDRTAFHPIPAASSLIRQRYQSDLPPDQAEPIEQWIPQAVQHYIQQHQLYKSASATER